MSETKKCEHPPCKCLAPDDEKYCSQYCKDAGETLELSCDCKHAGCALEVEAPIVPAEAA
jgi:hypothetical protein